MISLLALIVNIVIYCRQKHSSLFRENMSDKEQRFYVVETLLAKAILVCPSIFPLEKFAIWGHNYKAFYGRKLRIFVISQSICPWQAFPAQSNVQSQLESNLSYAPLQGTFKNCTRLERHAKDKRPSLSIPFVIYEEKSFIALTPTHPRLPRCIFLRRETASCSRGRHTCHHWQSTGHLSPLGSVS